MASPLLHNETLRLGGAEITRIADGESVAWPLPALFGGADSTLLAEAAPLLPPGHLDPAAGTIGLSFNLCLIRTPGFTALIDAGIGAGKERPSRPAWHRRESPLLETLAALGVAPDAVDLVVNTHLHADHVGWNTRRENGRWVPSFPRARYVIPRAELDHLAARQAADPATPALHGAYADSVLPVIEAGLVEPADPPCTIAPGLSLLPAPGHSPGQAVVRLETPAGAFVVLADAVHVTLQLARPELTSNFCANPAQAIATRRALLERLSAEGALVMAYHFPPPSFGRIERHGEGWRLRPMAAERREDS